jgi:hypothetical protein
MKKYKLRLPIRTPLPEKGSRVLSVRDVHCLNFLTVHRSTKYEKDLDEAFQYYKPNC